MAVVLDIVGMIADTDIMTTGLSKRDMIEIVERGTGREIGKAETMGVMNRDAVGIRGVTGTTDMREMDAVEITGMMGTDAVEITGMMGTDAVEITGMMGTDAVEIMGMKITKTH